MAKAQKLEVAYHEAGHAVVAYIAGCRILRAVFYIREREIHGGVTIDPSEEWDATIAAASAASLNAFDIRPRRGSMDYDDFRIRQSVGHDIDLPEEAPDAQFEAELNLRCETVYQRARTIVGDADIRAAIDTIAKELVRRMDSTRDGDLLIEGGDLMAILSASIPDLKGAHDKFDF